MLKSTDVEAKIREIIEEKSNLAKKIQEILGSEELQSYGMDSFAVINVVVAIEEYFEVEFDDEELIFDNFKSIDKLVDYVLRKTNI